MPEKQIFVKITPIGYGSHVHAQGSLADLMEEIKTAMAKRDLDHKWLVELVEMTQEEYDAMPEFTGY